MDDVFRALADPSRRALLDRLNERNGQTLRDLCSGLDMARQSVSKHLAILEDAGLVVTERRGREKLHYLDAAPINAVAGRWMTRYDRSRATALDDLRDALERPMDHFTYTTYIRTTPERVWEAITDPAFTIRYWGVRLTSDWTVGATVAWELDGLVMADDQQVVVESDPPRRLAYTWHTITPEFLERFGGDDADFVARAPAEPRSTVSFDIEPAGDTVKLTVHHSGMEPDGVILEGISGGWPQILASLKSLLETGEPLELG